VLFGQLYTHRNPSRFNAVVNVPEDSVQVGVECGELYVGRFSPFLQATQALKISRGIALLSSRTFGTRSVLGGSFPFPGRLYPRERPGTKGWVGSRAGLDGRKIFVPTGIRSRTIQPVAQSL